MFYSRGERLPPRRMDVDPPNVERIPVDQGMKDPLDRHVDRHLPPHMEHQRSRSPPRFHRGTGEFCLVSLTCSVIFNYL